MSPPMPPEEPRQNVRDVLGMVGWGVLIVVSIALLVSRFFGGGC